MKLFLLGFRASLPMLLGILPFGLITGATAVATGLSAGQAIAMAAIVFAGASQLAGLQLIAGGAPLFVIYLTTLFINLRFVMYSAALAPHLRHEAIGMKALVAYLLTDQAFAFSLHYYATTSEPKHKTWFYLGVAVAMWLTWMLANIMGVLLGARIPPGWSLDFAIPLTFMALLLPVVRDRPTVLAALVAAVVAVLGHSWPLNMGLIVAALAGIAAGTVAEGLKR
ncbi:MAG: AzlC family ABC transporter permease [Truepera sp.]|nr:AzlC family ABC transporter permease [Truepera sp.]